MLCMLYSLISLCVYTHTHTHTFAFPHTGIVTEQQKRKRALQNKSFQQKIDDKRGPNTQGELQNASPKQRKQSVYTPPTIKGVKHLKGQNESAFPEEEEGTNEREEQRDH
ncbi:protein phosphatase 1 regulatory subunit 1C isoform X1 [Homo sapiens]|uniref:protein phosphatase 1 regulatory subunit 1C isoform X1 n=1 Tax=Homo sapiens TaxID=9606 RepID=UPI0007DC7734|nr:protein phosphatase 1 regulatory subunit 1C isoform X1 [Homo sapiens]XP_054196732.1 protein phosphatase 1 regulatory subunit 1C isoform X1 [Homo sapiens]|eukprot:XP_016858940.1 protein phosphatase 1 regulatory subunit 1C isoform X1 [Homo sapiens]